MSDLAEIPTDDLAAELQRRYDVFFAVGVRDRLIGEDAQVESQFIHGEPLRLLGLIERAKFRVIIEMHDDSTDDDGDD